MRKILLIGVATVAAGGGLLALTIAPMAEVGGGYMAKIACSEVYLAGRDAEKVRAGEFLNISPALDRIALRFDETSRSVTATAYGFGLAHAEYRDGYGCTLVRGGAPMSLPELEPVAASTLAEAFENTPAARTDVDYNAINEALEAAFNDKKAATRAILVVKDGAVIAERYADGFSAGTPFLSWSMAKSVTATMVGAAVMRGFIDINAPAPVPEWRNDKARAAITWNDLLQMQSGLAFDETHSDPKSDASRMLFRARDTGGVAVRKTLEHPPGSFWSYSSGTTNIIQRTLRDTLEQNDAGYHSFARDTVFAPLGAASFTLEPDSSGAFIGSSFAYATARDWAKLGLLYLNDGVYGGRRLLPEGWARYVETPASASDNFYGAQFWLNLPGKSGREKYVPGVPAEAYMMAGHEGQYVLIMPDKDLIIVRTGMTRESEPMPTVAPIFAKIYAAVQ